MAKSSFYIEHLGCSKNQVDAETMASLLLQAGWSMEADAEKAALIIVNTCGFILPAKKESIEVALTLRQQHPKARILLAGCLSQRYHSDIEAELTEVDGIFGNRDLGRIVDVANRVLSGERVILVPQDAETAAVKPRRLLSALSSRPATVYVKPSEGCTNHCSFCAIPLIRGEILSRSIDDVEGEILSWLEQGMVEIVLVAQDLGSWGREQGETRLVPLLRRLSRLGGNFWIRLLYIHPDHFPEGLLELCAADERILPYFDIPFQHGHPDILEAMNRNPDPEANVALVKRIRATLPDAMIRTTYMVGFPGETEAHFEALLVFMKQVAADWAGVFTFSPEDNTLAAQLYRTKTMRVPAAVMNERKRKVEAAQTEISLGRLQRFVGRTLPVLVEEEVQGENLSLARCWAQAPEVDSLVVLNRAAKPGELVMARIEAIKGLDLDAVALG